MTETPVPAIHFATSLVPYRSLSPEGFRWLIRGAIAANLLIGLPMLLFGAWPVLGFMGLDVLLLWWLFKRSYLGARRRARAAPARRLLAARGLGCGGGAAGAGLARQQGRDRPLPGAGRARARRRRTQSGAFGAAFAALRARMGRALTRQKITFVCPMVLTFSKQLTDPGRPSCRRGRASCRRAIG